MKKKGIYKDNFEVLFMFADKVIVETDIYNFEIKLGTNIKIENGFFLNVGECGRRCNCCKFVDDENEKYDTGVPLLGLDLEKYDGYLEPVKINGNDIEVPVLWPPHCPFLNKRSHKCTLGDGSSESFYKNIPFLCTITPGWIMIQSEDCNYLTRRLCEGAVTKFYTKERLESDLLILQRFKDFYSSVDIGTEMITKIIKDIKEEGQKYIEGKIKMLPSWEYITDWWQN